MATPSEAFLELLAGKVPTAIYDVLHARRFLSDAGLQSPADVVGLIQFNLRYRHRPLERVACALIEEGYLNDGGANFFAKSP